MFAIQFVDVKSTEYSAEDQTGGFSLVGKNPIVEFFLARESARFLRRLFLLRTRASLRTAIGGFLRLIPVYRGLLCLITTEHPEIPKLDWDIEKHLSLTSKEIEQFLRVVADHALDKSLTDDQFIGRFDALMREKRPPVRLKAVA